MTTVLSFPYGIILNVFIVSPTGLVSEQESEVEETRALRTTPASQDALRDHL